MYRPEAPPLPLHTVHRLVVWAGAHCHMGLVLGAIAIDRSLEIAHSARDLEDQRAAHLAMLEGEQHITSAPLLLRCAAAARAHARGASRISARILRIAPSASAPLVCFLRLLAACSWRLSLFILQTDASGRKVAM